MEKNGLGVRLLTALIRVYQVTLAPFLSGHCRFKPHCSAYAIEALQKHHLRRGLWLALCRILRCHPFTQGGIDPVPPQHNKRKIRGAL